MGGEQFNSRFLLSVGIIVCTLIITLKIVPSHGYGRRKGRTFNGTHWIAQNKQKENNGTVTGRNGTNGNEAIYFLLKPGPGWYGSRTRGTHAPLRPVTNARTTKRHKFTRTTLARGRSPSTKKLLQTSTTRKPTTSMSITHKKPTSTNTPSSSAFTLATKQMVTITDSASFAKANDTEESDEGNGVYFGVNPPRFQPASDTAQPRAISGDTTDHNARDNKTTVKPCSNYENDPCGCRAAHCEFNSVKRECVPKRNNSACSKISYKSFACPRPNTLHSIGGVICKTPSPPGRTYDICKFTKVIMAINLKDSSSFADERGIHFAPNRGNIRTLARPSSIGDYQSHSVTSFLLTMNPIRGMNTKNASIPHKPLALFKGFQPPKLFGGICAVYVISLNQEGIYELAIKIATKLQPAARLITIVFNNHLIVEELDASAYLIPPSESGEAGQKYDEIEFSIVFEIQQKFNGTARIKTIFHMKGFPKSYIDNGETTLGICNGICGSQNNKFTPTSVINTISIVKLKID